MLFPTPLTPTNVMLYGVRCWFEVTGADSLLCIDRRRSVDVLGVRILVRDTDNAIRTAVLAAICPNE